MALSPGVFCTRCGKQGCDCSLKKLQAEIEKVKAERDANVELLVEITNANQENLLKEVATLTAQKKRLVEVLRKYGHHIGNGTFQCVTQNDGHVVQCLCGLDAALKENGDG